MKEFKELFLWSMNMKLYMGIYFSAVLFLIGLMYFVQGIYQISILTVFTGVGASMIVALLHIRMLDSHCDYSKGIFFSKTIIWILICTIIFGVAAIVFEWFKGLPDINYWIFTIAMCIGLIMMLWGEKLEQDASTDKLNESLKNYKQNNS